MHILHLTQLPYFFSFFFLKVLKVVAAPSEFFFPQFCVQPHHSPGAGAERLRGRGPMESRLVRSAGSRGPAGGVMGSVIVPAVWIGWGGVKGWGEKPWKKGRGGDTSITCAPSDPSLPLSLRGQTHCLRGGAAFSTGRCTSPSFVRDSIRCFS